MPKRDESHMAAVRQQILNAARAVFERKGVADAVIADVAAEAGLSVGSIYVHFRSKEDVLRTLIEQVDSNAPLFEACQSAPELLRLVESLLKYQDQASSAGQAARTALEVATFARRNADVQAIVSANFEDLRAALLDAVQRVARLGGAIDKPGAQAIGESLLSLLVAAQAQMLIGVSTGTDAKIKSARWLVAILHGAPVRARR